jgi:hypothetical protein
MLTLLCAMLGGVIAWLSIPRVVGFFDARADRRIADRSRLALSELEARNVERQLQNEDSAAFNATLDRKLHELPVGTRTRYRLSDGSDVWIRIDSERLKHENGAWGWEAIFEDDGGRSFADERRVVAAGALTLDETLQ